jgi:ribosome biogenesis GTPase A
MRCTLAWQQPWQSRSSPRKDRQHAQLMLTAPRLAALMATPVLCSTCRQETSRRLMVGLVGYPNVGKSSTINAIFGSKKTAVAPTPGKTKHFQTLNVTPTVCLCDCPGE